MTLTKVEKTSLIINHSRYPNHAHCRALHLASGIQTQAFCSVPTVTFLLQTILVRQGTENLTPTLFLPGIYVQPYVICFMRSWLL